LYGSDFPYTRAPGVEMLAEQMDNGVKGLFNEDEIEDIYHRNAERLFNRSI
jgi:predicted TIM-barrel fold metal-dependent hydrolase